MATQVFRIQRPDEYRKAGPTDLIELLPAPGSHALFIMKWLLETLAYAVVHAEFIHLSGPTGTAKSSLLEALYLVPENFRALCAALGFRPLPLKLYPIEMATYETPGELYQRRSLANGTTYDEKSKLVAALEDATEKKGVCYPLIWLREMGRVHSSSVQGGLLNLVTKGEVPLPDGTSINGQGIAWVADSNYQAEQDSTHTLVTFDDALKRRFCVNLTLDYLSAEQEIQVLRHILLEERGQKAKRLNAPLTQKVVHLGTVIRRHRGEGNLQSVPPPTIWGYLAFLRMAKALPHLSIHQVAMATLLGNASLEDRKQVAGVFNEVFGLQHADAEDQTLGVNLF
jgi:hypothetical protein